MENITILLNQIQDSFNKKNQIIESYKKQLSDLKKEKYGIGFLISEQEEKIINEWKNYHLLKEHKNDNVNETIGGRWQYIFTPTNLGTVGTIRCICGDCFTFRK